MGKRKRGRRRRKGEEKEEEEEERMMMRAGENGEKAEEGGGRGGEREEFFMENLVCQPLCYTLCLHFLNYSPHFRGVEGAEPQFFTGLTGLSDSSAEGEAERQPVR